MTAENDSENQKDLKKRRFSIEHNIFIGNLQDNSNYSHTNKQVATENDNNNPNRQLSIENDFLQGISNLPEVQTGYYCSNVKNDDIFNQYHNK